MTAHIQTVPHTGSARARPRAPTAAFVDVERSLLLTKRASALESLFRKPQGRGEKSATDLSVQNGRVGW